MAGFLLRIIINGVLLFIIAVKLPGVFVDTLGGTLLGAVLIGLANAVIRPLLELASAPLNLFTLGGSTFFMNVAAPLMVIKTLPGFQISSFLAPMVVITLMTVCSYTLSRVIPDHY